MEFIVYILRTSENTLYVGQTNNLDRRLKEHKGKKSRGAKYTRSFPSVELVYTEKFLTRGNALRREAEIKSWTKTKKESLVSGQ